MKFRAHETFFIRKGWLHKGLKNIGEAPDIFVKKDRNPVDILGIGSNMVKSLRYWLQATGLANEVSGSGEYQRKKVQYPTDLAIEIFSADRYFEELGTLFLVHYQLAKNKDNATTWYFFFNEFSLTEFQKEDFVNALQNYAKINSGEIPAVGSLEDDFNCLINTYVLRKKLNPSRVNPESNIECPLDELGLIEISDNSNPKDRTFRKATPKLNSIDPHVFMAILVDMNSKKDEIRISDLLASENVGRIFNLDIVGLSRMLENLSKLEWISVIRTAGLDVIKIKDKRSFLDWVKAYYASLNGK